MTCKIKFIVSAACSHCVNWRWHFVKSCDDENGLQEMRLCTVEYKAPLLDIRGNGIVCIKWKVQLLGRAEKTDGFGDVGLQFETLKVTYYTAEHVSRVEPGRAMSRSKKILYGARSSMFPSTFCLLHIPHISYRCSVIFSLLADAIIQSNLQVTHIINN